MEEAAARETQRQQAQAAARRDYSLRRRRHTQAWALWIVAIVMAVAHLFEHAGAVRLMTPALEDLLIGWPMAGLLAIIGGILYGT